LAKGKGSKSVHWRGSNVEYTGSSNRLSCRKCTHYDDKICTLSYTDLTVAGYDLFKFCKSFIVDSDEIYGNYNSNESKIQNKNKEKKNRVSSFNLKEDIIQNKTNSKNNISVNCKVTVYDYQFKENIEYIIVTPELMDILSNKISFNSPLGSALIGKSNGCEIEVDAPGGTIRYRIVRWSKVG
jgi:transcription elongation GreA/GreB family factor